MYHDQGHIPVKLLGFEVDPATGKWKELSGVNITLGLPIIRTSVDHGTAFDIAGKGIANERSLIEAIEYAERLRRASPDRADGGMNALLHADLDRASAAARISAPAPPRASAHCARRDGLQPRPGRRPTPSTRARVDRLALPGDARCLGRRAAGAGHPEPRSAAGRGEGGEARSRRRLRRR